MRDARIISLLPSATEIACVLGCADQLVGVSHECDFPAEIRGRPVLTLEWIDPLMIGGTWMPELVELAGGTAIGARAGEPAPTIDPAILRELAPEVVVVKPCGF